jgi:3-deoxy-D-manno-octulosonic-acid transferase
MVRAVPHCVLGRVVHGCGGQTPFEPAVHAKILHGPLYAYLSRVYTAFTRKNASVEVADSTTLAAEVATLLTHPSRAVQLAANARPLARTGDAALEDLTKWLFSLSDPRATDTAR